MKLLFHLPIEDRFRLDDDWPLTLPGNIVFRSKREDGYVTAFQVERSVPIQEIYSVTGETKTWVLDHLGDTMKFLSKLRTYIQLVGEIEFDATRTILYLEPETPQEEELSLPSGPIELVISGRPEKTPIFNFQVFTAILWKCQGDVPTHLRFMGELKAMGRRSYRQGRFLDSFRFNFLLVDSLYGQGQFKTKALIGALCSSEKFVTALDRARMNLRYSTSSVESKTERLICGNYTIDDLIEHLVKCRGRYFHGNRHLKHQHHLEKDGGKVLGRLLDEVTDLICAEELQDIHHDTSMQSMYEQGAREQGLIHAIKIDLKFIDHSEDEPIFADKTITVAGRSDNYRQCARWALRALEGVEYDWSKMSLVQVIGEEEFGETLFRIDINDMSCKKGSEEEYSKESWIYSVDVEFAYHEDNEDQESTFELGVNVDKPELSRWAAMTLMKQAINHSLKANLEGIWYICGKDTQDESIVFEAAIHPNSQDTGESANKAG